MNGDGYIMQEAPSGGNVVSDFFGAAQAKISDFTASVQERFTSRPQYASQSVGGSIFEALYQVGKGRFDLVRQQAATALLQSKTGQRFVGEVERQRIQQWMPYIIGGALLLIFIGVFAGRR